VKILVTGANGQVGYELVQLGPLLGHEIIAAGREELDISDQEAVKNFVDLHQPEAIINAAAYTAVDKAESEQKQAFAVNARAVDLLSSVAVALNIPLLHVSTDYVFDGEKTSAYQESDKTAPINVYGSSKREGEVLLENSGANYLILRTSWVFGRKGNNFVKTMFRLGSERDALSIIDDQWGCPTYAGDIAVALLSAAPVIAQGKKVGLYHYAGDTTVTWFEFAQAVFDTASEMNVIEHMPRLTPIPTTAYPTPARRPKNSVLDSSKFMADFNIEPSAWRTKIESVLAES
jgi:dTDP-4-dehydrorhamnose reductase